MLARRVFLSLVVATSAASAQRPRARDLGISPLIGGTPGALDAITDVRGVEVGQTTLIAGAPGPLKVARGRCVLA